MEEEKVRNIEIGVPPFITQRLLRKIGMADSTSLGNDIYYELKALDMLIEYLGETFVKKEFEKDTGKNWEKTKKEIKKISDQVARCKPLWDLIEDKKFVKIDKPEQRKAKELFIKNASKIPLFNNPVTFVFTWILKKSSVQRATVPSDAYKILEQSGFKPMDVRRDRPKETLHVTP